MNSPHAYVILGQRHNSTEVEQIGDAIPAPEARDTFMPYREKKTDPDFQRVWLGKIEIERDERFALPEPEAVDASAKPKKEGKSHMKSIKSLLSMIAFAALLLTAPVAQAQSYNLTTAGFAATFNIAGASTNTTVSATNGSAITIRGGVFLAIQPTFKLTEAGTSTVVLKFDESVDGSTWKIASRSISVAANGTTTVGTVLNITDACANFFRLSQIENPNTGALTNIVLKYAYKTP